ncbi:hypothetical protein BER2_3035 [plant metagenome]|uniref:Uncharacterized protein n=1 Tax=plant metagenome TaxID=1297885 RepID=A0A484QIE5_9ZZZZ
MPNSALAGLSDRCAWPMRQAAQDQSSKRRASAAVSAPWQGADAQAALGAGAVRHEAGARLHRGSARSQAWGAGGR